MGLSLFRRRGLAYRATLGGIAGTSSRKPGKDDRADPKHPPRRPDRHQDKDIEPTGTVVLGGSTQEQSDTQVPKREQDLGHAPLQP